MTIRCLGAVGAVYEGEFTAVSKAQRRILAGLTAAGPDGLDSASFADELWLEKLPGDWETALRMAVSRLRRALPSGTIERSGGRYRLALASAEVDVWDLLQPPCSETVTDAVAMRRLTGEPYPALEPSPLMRRSTESIATARVELVDWMAAHPQAWSRPTLQVAQTLARHRLYHEELFRSVARLLTATGHMGLGRSLLEEGIGYLTSELEVEPAGETMELLQGIAQPSAELGTREPRALGAVTVQTDNVVHRPQLQADLQSALTQQGTLLTGEPGSGKTVATSTLATDYLGRGHHVVRIVGRRNTSDAYGPLLVIDPSVSKALMPLLADGGTALTRSQCWLAALAAMQLVLPDLPILLIVDDAQWLDSHSQRFVEFLVAAQSTSRVMVLVVGRADPAAPSWQEFSTDLTRMGLRGVVATSFSPSELASLVGHQFPNSSSKQRVDLAAQLELNRATAPAIASELIRRADPNTLVLPTHSSNDPVSGAWTHHVSADSHRVASVAAVIGITFRSDTVTALGDFDTDRVADTIDELLEENLIVEEARPGEFSFRHVLIHKAFEDWLSRAERRRLHLRAAESVVEGVHHRARHLHHAGSLSDPAVTSEALVASARNHRGHGSFSEAVAAFAVAESYGEHNLGAQELCDYADASDRSGGDGWPIRDRAFARAMRDHDYELAVHVACSGARESEDITGDPRRADMLRLIPVDELVPASRTTRDLMLARQLGLMGEHEEALSLTAACADQADSADASTEAWLGAWVSISSLPVGQWPPLRADRDQITDPSVAARLLQTVALRALLEGRTLDARAALGDLQAAPFTSEDGLCLWYAMLLECFFANVDGNWQLGNELGERAMQHGQRIGIGGAFSSRAAQLFTQHWLAGTHVQLLPLLDVAAPDVSSSLIAEAAYAATMAEVPERRDEATTAVAQLVQQMVARSTPFTAPAAGLLASAPATLIEPHRHDLCSILEPFAGTHLIVGLGVASVGPASRALSLLTEDPDTKIALLHTAVEEADRWLLPVWSVRCRYDLATLTRDSELLNQARSMASPGLADQLFA